MATVHLELEKRKKYDSGGFLAVTFHPYLKPLCRLCHLSVHCIPTVKMEAVLAHKYWCCVPNCRISCPALHFPCVKRSVAGVSTPCHFVQLIDITNFTRTKMYTRQVLVRLSTCFGTSRLPSSRSPLVSLRNTLKMVRCKASG